MTGIMKRLLIKYCSNILNNLALAGKVKETGEWLKARTEDVTQYTVKVEKTTDWKQIFLEVSYWRLFLFLWTIAVGHSISSLSDWDNLSKIGGIDGVFLGLAGLLQRTFQGKARGNSRGTALPARGKPRPFRLFYSCFTLSEIEF